MSAFFKRFQGEHMADKISKWQKFKRFLKRNMTPTWAKHFSYQVFSFIVSVALIIGVANYALTKSYDERKLTFVDGFTITAHTGAFHTTDNTIESVKVCIENNVDILEIDIRQRPDSTVVMGHDIIVTNNDGTPVEEVFKLMQDVDIKINLDIKETKVLKKLHKLIFDYNMQGKVFLTGIEPHQTDTVKKDCPDIDYYINYVPSRFKIFSEDYQQKILRILEETGAIGINCNHANSSATLSNLLHNNGYKLSVWTVDKERNIKRALVNKSDNITTHYPDKVQHVIDNWGK